MDMNEIKEIFFQECEEQLAELESGLLKMNDGDRDRKRSMPYSARFTPSRAAQVPSVLMTWLPSRTSSRRLLIAFVPTSWSLARKS